MKINDERIKEWINKCPEHDNELLHSDDNGHMRQHQKSRL